MQKNFWDSQMVLEVDNAGWVLSLISLKNVRLFLFSDKGPSSLILNQSFRSCGELEVKVTIFCNSFISPPFESGLAL